jgi:hypothetical protein
LAKGNTNMRPKIVWSDLIIEEGKLDPLGLWRVGDRLVSELLSPFTTIVSHRPARYFAMYTWIIHYLNNMNSDNINKFWERFFEIEAVFLCAIQCHEKHNYDYFRGRIGGEHAKKILAQSKGNKIDFSKIKISNGWENNYKTPMYDFNLIETDFGIISGLKVTPAGKQIALAYQSSISSSLFSRKYLNKFTIPKNVIIELSQYSCPCLFYKPKTSSIEKEKNTLIKFMLDKNLAGMSTSNNEKLTTLLSSIYLIIHFMKGLNKKNYPFTYEAWRKTLSTRVHFDFKIYSPPKEYEEIYKKWELYNLDSMLVFSLESALAGFLDFLHKNNNLKAHVIYSRIKNYFHDELKKINKIGDIKISAPLNDIRNNIVALSYNQLKKLENELIEKVKREESLKKIIYSYFLLIYIQAQYLKRIQSSKYENSIKFLNELSNIDGMELSLLQSLDETCNDSILFFLEEVFFKKWIIARQLDTRLRRQKDVAWFSYNSETDSFSWESNYETYLYRAARSEILMTFLLNLEIVKHEQAGWFLNPNSYLYKQF